MAAKAHVHHVFPVGDGDDIDHMGPVYARPSTTNMFLEVLEQVNDNVTDQPPNVSSSPPLIALQTLAPTLVTAYPIVLSMVPKKALFSIQ